MFSMTDKKTKLTSLLVSAALALSIGLAGVSAATTNTSANASDAPEAIDFSQIVDVTYSDDETALDEDASAYREALILTRDSLAPASTENCVSYLDALTEPGNVQKPILTVNMGEASTTASMANDYSAGVAYKSTRHAKFYDRLDISKSSFAKTIYNSYKEFTDFDGTKDVLINDSTYKLKTSGFSKAATTSNATVGKVFYDEYMNYVVLAKVNIGKNDPYAVSAAIADWGQAAWISFLRDVPETNFWFTRDMPAIGLMHLPNKSLDDPSSSTTYAIVMLTVQNNSGTTTVMRNSEWNSANKIKTTHTQMMNQVNSLVSQATSLPTDYDKVKFYNQWLCDNNEYFYGANQSHWIPFTAPAALLNLSQDPVCEGYAKALELLCQKSSIPVTVQSGRTHEDHMWNLVQLAGKWYMTDVTYNDTGYANDTYLTVGTSTYSSTHTVDDSVTYYYNDGSEAVRYSFENAPLVEENGYLGQDIVTAEGYGPEEPICIPYGSTLTETIANPSDYFKSNVPVSDWIIDHADEPMLDMSVKTLTATGFPVDYEKYDPITVEFSIEVVPVETSVMMEIESGTYTYTGSEICPAVTVYKVTNEKSRAAGEVINPDTYRVYYHDNIDVGEALVEVESKDDSPYKFYASATFQIVEDQTTPPVVGIDFTATLSGEAIYGGTAVVNVTGAPEGSDIKYEAVKGNIGTIGNNLVFNSIGAASVKVTVTKDGVSASKTIDFTVAKRTLNVTAKANDKTYDGNTKASGSIEIGNIAGGDSGLVTVSIDDAQFADKNTGTSKHVTFKLSASGDKSNCYIVPTTLTATASITPRAIDDMTVRITGGNVKNGTDTSALPKTIQLTGVAQDKVASNVEWFEDAACAKALPTGYKFAGKKGDKITLYYKVTPTDSNYTGSKTGSTEFTLADDPAGTGNENQNTNQGGTNTNTNTNSNTGSNTNTNANTNTNTGANTNQGNTNENVNQGGANTNTNVNTGSNSNTNTGSNENQGENVNWSGNENQGGNAGNGNGNGSDDNNGNNGGDANIPATGNDGAAGAGDGNGGNQSDSGNGSQIADDAVTSADAVGNNGGALTQAGDAILGVVALAMFSIVGVIAAGVIARRRK